MSVTVKFRGVMLFCTETRDGKTFVRDVFLPDGDHVVPPDGTERGDEFYHLDGTRARPHYARIVVAAEDNWPQYYAIRGKCVSIGSTDTEPPEVSDVLNSFANLDRLAAHGPASPLRLRAPLPAQTHVRLGTPSVPVTPDDIYGSEIDFRLGKQTQLALGVSLTFDAPCVIAVSDAPALRIPDGATVWICNYDKEMPALSDLDGQSAPTEPSIVDHDFKWLYALVEPLTSKLPVWAGGYLPAPEWSEPDGISARTISVSTCFPGRISK